MAVASEGLDPVQPRSDHMSGREPEGTAPCAFFHSWEVCDSRLHLGAAGGTA